MNDKLLGNAEPTHVGMTVSNLERSMSFYVECLGFEIEQPTRNVVQKEYLGLGEVEMEAGYLQKGKFLLELVEYVKPTRAAEEPQPNIAGYCHFSFQVPDIPRLYETFKARGIRCLAPPARSPRSGAYTLMIRDPDGCLIELVEHSGFGGR